MTKDSYIKDRSITVTGTGTAKGTPDTALITLGVVTEGTNLQRLQQENAAKTQAVINSLVQSFVPIENISTQSYSIEPMYDYRDGTQVFTGYRVTNLLSITTKNLGQVGTLIDNAVSSGANRVVGINFIIEDNSLLYSEALSLAVRDARSKAETLSQESGLQVNNVPSSILEEFTTTPYPQPIAFSSAVSTPILPGELQVTATITAVFS